MKHKQGEIPPTSPHADSLGKDSSDRLNIPAGRRRAFLRVPQEHWRKIWSTNPQGRLKVRHKAAGETMLVPVLSGLLPSVGPFCYQC